MEGFPPILPRGAAPTGDAVPRFLMGRSMGGCLATLTATRMVRAPRPPLLCVVAALDGLGGKEEC